MKTIKSFLWISQFCQKDWISKFDFVTSVDVAGHQRVKQKIPLFFENGLKGLK